MLARCGVLRRPVLCRTAAPATMVVVGPARGSTQCASGAAPALRRRELWTGIHTWTVRGGLRDLTSVAGCRAAGSSFRGWASQRAAAVRPVTLRKRGFAGGGTANPNGAFYERHPVMVAVFVATIKTAAADIIVQTQIEKKDAVDWRRVGLFTAFGACYFGAFQYFLYVKCFSWWFDAVRLSKMSMAAIFAEGGAGRANFLKQIGFDLFVINHFFFTMYYGFKISITDPEVSIFEGGTPDQWAMAAWKKYAKNNFASGPGGPGFLEDWIGFWKVWIIGDIIVFGMVPLWARLPVNNTISFIYVLVLSFMRGAPDEDELAKSAAAKQQLEPA
jgi:hypothetical protein